MLLSQNNIFLLHAVFSCSVSHRFGAVLKVDARLSEHKLQISFELIEREPIARLNSLGATDINANLGASEFMVKNITFYRMPSVKLVLNSLVLWSTYNYIFLWSLVHIWMYSENSVIRSFSILNIFQCLRYKWLREKN